MTNLPDVHQKDSALQCTIGFIVNEHCPVKRVKKRHRRAPWLDRLATKLKNAKKKAYAKGCPTSKLFGNRLKKVKADPQVQVQKTLDE